MPLSDEIAIAAVLTKGVLQEFELLKFSFELFHGTGFHWFLRCDAYVADIFDTTEHVHCQVFEPAQEHRADAGSDRFKKIVFQKMDAIEFAWRARDWEAVAFMDADLIATSPFLAEFAGLQNQVLLSPHFYHPSRKEHDEAEFGTYNSGFILMRSRSFAQWWRKAFAADEGKFSDQNCFDRAAELFDVGLLTEAANYGFWRGESGQNFSLPPIPEDCQFLHLHVFQPNITSFDLVRTSFVNEMLFRVGKQEFRFTFDPVHITHKITALHCLAFLRSSRDPKRRLLYQEILRRDQLKLYSAILEG